MNRSSEELLADFVRARTEESFREIVRRHLPLVYSTALRVANGDKHLAEDVSQMVFSDLVVKARHLPAGTILSGWLYQHAWFSASKSVRSERRRETREQQSFAMKQDSSATDEADLAQLGPALDEALATLKPEDRDAIVLRFFDRADLQRVGLALGISEDAAQKRVSRALEKLRTLLESRGMTISAAGLSTVLAAQMAVVPAALAQSIAAGSLVTAGASIGTILTSTKFKLATAGALVVAVTVPMVHQSQRLSAVRNENQALHARVAESEQLKAENRKLRAEALSAADIQRMNKDLLELQRLRGEITLLRRRYHEATNSAAALAAAGTAEKVEVLQVTVNTRVAELSHERMAALLQEGFPAVSDARNFTLTVVPDTAVEVFRLFEEAEGVDLLSAPRISTADGREARVEVTEDLLLESGEKLPLGLSVGMVPTILADRISVALKLDIKLTEFLGWENEAQTIPRTRARAAQHEASLQHGQVLMMGRSVLRAEGDKTEPKLQIYCFNSSVIDASGTPVALRSSEE